MSRMIPLFLLLAACGRPVPDGSASTDTNTGDVRNPAGAAEGGSLTASAPPAPAASPSSRDLSGRWVGVEGMYLDVVPAGADAYALTMQYDLDHKGSFKGRADGDHITFERDGKTLTLVPSDGAATGLKYLAAKKDCLTVAAGEGYCRD